MSYRDFESARVGLRWSIQVYFRARGGNKRQGEAVIRIESQASQEYESVSE